MTRTSNLDSISTQQQRIAELAKEDPNRVLTSLAHHIDVDWLHEAYRRTRKDGAVGVDGETAEVYATKLEENLRSLLDRAKSGRYRAPPVRRVHIPKGDGMTRPLGIPTFEDKILQRAVLMVLEPLYEQDFLDCSYGFRPRRSAHQALHALRETLIRRRGGWVLEVDVSKFFDTLEHSRLREILRNRVCDGVLLRLIGKWLNAGVLEAGTVLRSESGTPQGGVISPLLANIYLHEVLDVWFERVVKPRMRGQAHFVRFADDFVMVFDQEDDARRVLAILPKRFGKFGLTLHPEKTRLVPFQRPPAADLSTGESRAGKRGTFDLLGFTHYWARSRSGYWVIKLKTAKSRLSRAIRRISDWCRTHRHLPLKKQQETLTQKLLGHCEYYGLTGNSQALERFRTGLLWAWRKWLNRRSHHARMNWERFNRMMVEYPIPPATAVHSSCRHIAKP